MNKCFFTAFATLILFTMVGCKIWVKRGATPEQLFLDQSECHIQADDDQSGEAYLECMRNRGWYHQDKSLEPPAYDTATWTKSLPMQPQLQEQGPATAEEQSTSYDSPATDSTPGEEFPQDEHHVGSWWKIGGSPEQLKQDQNCCHSELRSADKSSVLQWTATPAFTRCMKDKGWYGFTE